MKEIDLGVRIVCAANMYADNAIVAGVRHLDVNMRKQVERQTLWTPSVQGFLDNKGRFHTRREAWKIAEAAGQILRRVGGDTTDGGTLYSENLY